MDNAQWTALFGHLRAAMVRHDFSGDDLQVAATSQLEVFAYVLSVPAPSSARTDSPLVVELEQSGAFTVKHHGLSRSGQNLGDIPRHIPRATDEGDIITIVADPGIQHQQLIQVMDALRELGYKKVRLGERP